MTCILWLGCVLNFRNCKQLSLFLDYRVDVELEFLIAFRCVGVGTAALVESDRNEVRARVALAHDSSGSVGQRSTCVLECLSVQLEEVLSLVLHHKVLLVGLKRYVLFLVARVLLLELNQIDICALLIIDC